jgi:hypothetical protein
MSSPLKTIANFLTPEDAEVARVALENEGVPAFLEGVTTIGMLWYLGNAIGWVKLQVMEEDEKRAREILSQKTDDLENVSLDVLVCPKCGVDIPPGFEVCWKCQSPLEGEKEANRLEPPTISPGEQDQELAVKETDPGDAMAWRAFCAAVLGLFVCPPLLTIYSVWLLLKIAFREPTLSSKGNRSYYVAMFIDFAILSMAGWMISHL